jgi:hypothetical protein
LTRLLKLHVAGRPSVACELTVTYASGYSDIGTCDTFEGLSAAIDAAMAALGFTRYEVGPAGDR